MEGTRGTHKGHRTRPSVRHVLEQPRSSASETEQRHRCYQRIRTSCGSLTQLQRRLWQYGDRGILTLTLAITAGSTHISTSFSPSIFCQVGGQSMGGDVPAAMEWYRQAVAIDPTSLRAYMNLGSALAATDKVEVWYASRWQKLKTEKCH